MRILVVSAHPDDAELGMGATIAKHTEAGDEVSVMVMGSGILARDTYDPEAVDTLAKQCRRSLEILGVQRHKVVFKDVDNKMDLVPLLDVTKKIEQEIAEWKPETVYTHWIGDRNVDHRIVCDSVLTATRPIPGCTVKRVLSFEVPSSTEWGFTEPFKPNYFVQAKGDERRAKFDALACYETEMRDYPHPRSVEAIEALMSWRGATVGVGMAEAFVLVRGIE